MWPLCDVESPIVNTLHRHAFTMAGRDQLFLCHMPMLDMEDHMYQLVLQVRLPEQAMQRYQTMYDKQDPDNTFFVVNQEAEPMSLLELTTGRRKGFLADVWDKATVRQGEKIPPWLENNPFIKGTQVDIDRVVYFRHFDLNFDRPRFLTYVLFGSGDEAHLYHCLSGQPDFDHVVSLAEVPDWLPRDKDGYRPQLEAGIHVNFPELPDTPANFFLLDAMSQGPLEPGSTHPVQYHGMERVVQHSHEGFVEVEVPRYAVTIARSLWFNTSICNTRDPAGLPMPSSGHDH